MARGIEVAEWARLSVQLAELWNTVRSSKMKPFKPSQFNPYDKHGRLKSADKPKSDFANDMRSLFPTLKGKTDARSHS